VSDLSRGVESHADPEPSFANLSEAASSVHDSTRAPLREGLPPTYRMRADAHYIDQLAAPPAITVQLIATTAIDANEDGTVAAPMLVESIARHGLLEPLIVQLRDRRYRIICGRKRLAAAVAAGLREVPCIVRRVGDEEARTLIKAAQSVKPAPELRPASITPIDQELAGALAAVASCAAMLGDDIAGLPRTVTVDMVRAQAHRAACLLNARRVLQDGVPEMRRLVSPRDVMQRVADVVTADLRLRGIGIDRADDAGRIRIGVDEELLASALAGVALMLAAALVRADDARLRLSAAVTPAGRVTLTMEQESVVVPASWLTVSIASPSDATVAPQLLPLAALRQLAEAYGGSITTTRLPHATRLALELPIVSR
jgi:hypothetical protein